MNDPACVGKRQRIGHFKQPAAYVIDWQRSALLQLRGEVVPVDAGHHEEHQIPHLVDRVDGHDVRVTQLRGGFGFPQEPRAHVAAERQLRWQQLDRHVPLEAAVAGTVDDAHAAATDLPTKDKSLVSKIPLVQHFTSTPHDINAKQTPIALLFTGESDSIFQLVPLA